MITDIPDARQGRPQVPAADQTLRILRHLARRPSPIAATGLARDLGIPRSTVYHLLSTLEEHGFVVHLPQERRWGLGTSAFELAGGYARQEPLARLGRPILAALADRIGESGADPRAGARGMPSFCWAGGPGGRPTWAPELSETTATAPPRAPRGGSPGWGIEPCLNPPP